MKNQTIDNRSSLFIIKKWFKNYPLIIWNVFSVLLLFITPWLALITFCVSLFFWNKRNKEVSKENKEQQKKKMVSDAEDFVNNIRNTKTLPTIESSIFLEKDEKAFLEESTKFLETRAVREYNAGTRNISFGIAKGVRVGFGGVKGYSQSNQEWKLIDGGKLTITNKRLIFTGHKETKVILLKNILSVIITLDSIEIAIDSRSKKVCFSVNNGYIWGAIINIIKSVNDPLNLGDIKLDIQFD